MTSEKSTLSSVGQAMDNVSAAASPVTQNMEVPMEEARTNKKRPRNRLSIAKTSEIEQKMAALINDGHPVEAITILLGIDIKQARKVYTDISQRGEVPRRVPDYRVVSSTKSIWSLFSKNKVDTHMKVERQDDGSFVIRPFSVA